MKNENNPAPLIGAVLYLVWTKNYGEDEWIVSYKTSDEKAAKEFRQTAKQSGLRAKVLPEGFAP